MCGIVGLVKKRGSQVPYNDMTEARNFFSRLLEKASARGNGATGMLAAHRYRYAEEKTRIKTLRAPIPAGEFVHSAAYTKVMRDIIDDGLLTLIGHTRAATGTNAPASKNYNNHPFRSGRIMGVHNGAIRNAISLANKKKLSLRGRCDSEALFALVNHYQKDSVGASVGSAIKQALDDLDKHSWYAFALIDIERASRVYLVRDEFSPLSVAFAPKIKSTVFASTVEIIDSAAKAANIDITGSISLKAHTLYAVDSLDRKEGLHLSVLEPEVGNKDAQLLEEDKEDWQTTQGSIG